jgi:hypothetical protein
MADDMTPRGTVFRRVGGTAPAVGRECSVTAASASASLIRSSSHPKSGILVSISLLASITREAPMPPLDPRTDFQDDGRTPAWLRRQRAIRLNEPGFAGWWNRASYGKIFLAAFALAFFVPMAVLIGGLMIAYWWSGGR